MERTQARKMPLKLNLTISNKAIYAFIVVIVVSLLVASAYAYVVADPPLPVPPVGQVVGHSLDTIQGYFVGDVSLRDTLAKLQQSPVGGMSCPSGRSIRSIDTEGNVVCEFDDGPAMGGMYAVCCDGACATPNPATGSCSCPAGFSTSSIDISVGLEDCGGGPCITRGRIRFCYD